MSRPSICVLLMLLCVSGQVRATPTLYVPYYGFLKSGPIHRMALRGVMSFDKHPGEGIGLGDHLFGVARVSDIYRIDTGEITWRDSPNDQFTAYLNGEVIEVNVYPPPYSLIELKLGPTSDPHGVLSGGEIVKFFVDEGPGNTKFDIQSPVTEGIVQATDGAPWASFTGTITVTFDPNGYGSSFGSLDVVRNDSNYKLLLLNGTFWPSAELLLDGELSAPPYTPPGQGTPWQYQFDDPIYIRPGRTYKTLRKLQRVPIPYPRPDFPK